MRTMLSAKRLWRIHTLHPIVNTRVGNRVIGADVNNLQAEVSTVEFVQSALLEGVPDQLKLGPGDTVRFFAALDDVRRSPSTWRVWMPNNSSDVYVASRHLAGIIKTSLHESGSWQTSFIRDDLMPTDNSGLAASRHLDRWTRPDEFAEGYTQALTIIIPWTELVPWREEGVPTGTLRLMMEENCALSVEMLLLRPVMFPVPLHFTDSIIFAAFDLGNDNEFVLVSRKIPWTDIDVQMLKEEKTGAPASARSFADPRQVKQTSENVSHITRLTMFRMSEQGHRYILDASSWTAPPITVEPN